MLPLPFLFHLPLFHQRSLVQWLKDQLLTWLSHLWSELHFIERAALLTSLILGTIFIFLVPPFQKPDENVHFLRVAGLAQGTLVCGLTDEGVYSQPVPENLATLPEATFALNLAGNPSVKFSPQTLSRLLQHPGASELVNEPSSCSLPALLYLPTAAGLAPLVWLHANPIIIFYLGRILNFVIGFALFLLALKFSPRRLRPLLLLTFLLPMSLHQITSLSKDALHLSFGLLGIALLWKGTTPRLTLLTHPFNRSLSLTELMVLFGSLVMVVMARPQYLLWILLPLLLPKAKVSGRRLSLRTLTTLVVIAMASVLFISLSLGTYSSKAAQLNTTNPDPYVNPAAQLEYLRDYPGQILVVAWNTIEQLGPFYVTSLIGRLGWLDYSLTWLVYGGYVITTIVLLTRTTRDLPQLNPAKKLLLTGIVVGTMSAIFAAMYLYASPVGSNVVKGVQGRYFILLLPLAIWLVGQAKSYLSKLVVPTFLMLIIIVTGSIVKRYYWYSDHYYPAQPLPASSALHVEHGQAATTPVVAPLAHKLRLDQSRKLRGLAILVAGQPQITTTYQVSLLDSNCQTTYRHTVLDSSLLPHSIAYTEVLLRPLQSPSQELCVMIQPYHPSEFSLQTPLKLVLSPQQNWFIIPLYQY